MAGMLVSGGEGRRRERNFEVHNAIRAQCAHLGGAIYVADSPSANVACGLQL